MPVNKVFHKSNNCPKRSKKPSLRGFYVLLQHDRVGEVKASLELRKTLRSQVVEVDLITMIDKDEVGGLAALNENIDTLAFACPAAADHQLVADGDTKGRFIGGMIKYTCITDSKWVVTGHLFGDGTAATPFT